MSSRPLLKWQFQTFTLKHSELSLELQLKRLVACFRRLRHRKLWQSTVTTGYAVIEVTFHAAGSWSPTGRRREQAEWHPHLHVLAATEFIDWSQLRRDWRSVTGDSDNIDCELVESRYNAARYISKYIGKPPDLSLEDDPQQAIEYYRALRHRRLLMPFGDTAHHKVTAQPPARPSIKIARFDQIRNAASTGNYPAQCMLTHIILATVPQPAYTPQTESTLFSRGPP